MDLISLPVELRYILLNQIPVPKLYDLLSTSPLFHIYRTRELVKRFHSYKPIHYTKNYIKDLFHSGNLSALRDHPLSPFSSYSITYSRNRNGQKQQNWRYFTLHFDTVCRRGHIPLLKWMIQECLKPTVFDPHHKSPYMHAFPLLDDQIKQWIISNLISSECKFSFEKRIELFECLTSQLKDPTLDLTRCDLLNHLLSTYNGQFFGYILIHPYYGPYFLTYAPYILKRCIRARLRHSLSIFFNIYPNELRKAYYKLILPYISLLDIPDEDNLSLNGLIQYMEEHNQGIDISSFDSFYTTITTCPLPIV